ncbi:unnamed protein product [Calypogeia fissa]
MALSRPSVFASLPELKQLQCPQFPMTVARQINGQVLFPSNFHLGQWHRISSSTLFREPSRQESSKPTRGFKVCASRSKGFGDLVKKNKREADGKKAVPITCPCGGGTELKEYVACCGRFHGGVVEPDALTLMKARFSAYARGVVPYVVKTTHPDNPAFEGAEKLAEDVRATCERLRFFKLEILDFKEVSESEAFVSFVAHYTLVKGGRGGERKELKEESRFVKEGGRWFYREGLVSPASEAAWVVSTNT